MERNLFIKLICAALFFGGLGIMVPARPYAQVIIRPPANGLVLWVDAQDVNGNGTDPANGATISTWVDKSGGNHNLSSVGSVAVTYEENGLDGVNPSLRLPSDSRMSAPNPFPNNTSSQTTFFLVLSNITLPSPVSFSLNGASTSDSNRFQVHTPWFDGKVYFDAGTSNGTSRVSNPSPISATDTGIYVGINDLAGNKQHLRVDGNLIASDNTGHSPDVSGGINVGSSTTSLNKFNGRFAEIIVYDRTLSDNEVEQIECYLAAKWKPSTAKPGCLPSLSVTTSTQPVNTSGSGNFYIPGNDFISHINVTKSAGASIGKNSVFITHPIPSDATFYNGDIDDAGPATDPITFSGAGSGLTFNYSTDAKYSNAATAPTSMADCTYTPASGYDANVKYICLNPKGAFLAGNSAQSVTVNFRAQIK